MLINVIKSRGMLVKRVIKSCGIYDASHNILHTRLIHAESKMPAWANFDFIHRWRSWQKQCQLMQQITWFCKFSISAFCVANIFCYIAWIHITYIRYKQFWRREYLAISSIEKGNYSICWRNLIVKWTCTISYMGGGGCWNFRL